MLIRKFLFFKKSSLIIIIAFFSIQKQLIGEEKKIKIIAEEVQMHSFYEVIKIDPKAPPKKEDPKNPVEPVDPNAPPKIVGSDVEIVTRILKKLKIPFEVEIVKWNELVPMIKEGKADIALGIQKSVLLKKYAYFPRTSLRTRNYIFHRLKTEIGDSETLSYEEAVAKNLIVGIVVGFTYPKEFWDFYPYENLQLNRLLYETKDYKDNIIKLKQNKIDLFIADRERTSALLKKLGAEETVFQYRNVLYWRDYYCVFPNKAQYPNKEKLLSQFERELYKMKEKDEIPVINEMWIEKGF
ncbi:substrate-binding periplasmic protein [Fluviispira multicolorata]|uniref:Transporter substrate-binding domain-containing protein n=1 Tax=Fluviispira multicolorata TaxID=2654512 RepID=A0A833N4F2_9BACT|nr:transporter substrate-binding domain-containing protein [Fluviispira multicolorata]KAB8031971.1 transporter substrate-binding domain-containing protein [Fluviispira multicolorata]